MESALIQYTVDPDFIEADQVLEAMHSILRYRDPRFSLKDTLEHLEDIYRRGAEVTRYKIFSELIDIECKEALPLLIHGLKEDGSGLVRHEAAFGIGLLGSTEHGEILMDTLLNDNNPMVRHEAAIALAEIGSESVIDTLIKATQDPSQEVSTSARFALQNIHLKLLLGMRDK